MEQLEWGKKIHVKSSLKSKKNQYAMFIGRFQPIHEGHIRLFQQAIIEKKHLLICIRDGKVNDKNPYTAKEVKKVIKAISNNWWTEDFLILIGEFRPKIKIKIIPDICSVEFGRGVGYDIIEHIPPIKIAEVSATKIRKQMRTEGKL